jgi:hypothetical protein
VVRSVGLFCYLARMGRAPSCLRKFAIAKLYIAQGSNITAIFVFPPSELPNFLHAGSYGHSKNFFLLVLSSGSRGTSTSIDQKGQNFTFFHFFHRGHVISPHHDALHPQEWYLFLMKSLVRHDAHTQSATGCDPPDVWARKGRNLTKSKSSK